MVAKTNSFSSAYQNIGSDVQYYIVYAKSPNAFSSPEIASGVNIRVTKNYQDISQKNFEVLLQSIGLRSMPVIMNNPEPVQQLENNGSLTLVGEGFVWKFAVDRSEIFYNYGPNGTIGPVGFLVDELHGIILPSGVVLDTKYTRNIEFNYSNKL